MRQTTDTTAQIRQQIRKKRRKLSAQTQKQHSERLRQHLTLQNNYRNASHLGCYLANDGEIDIHPIIEHAWFMGKRVYLPVLSPLKNQLYFAPYHHHTKLQTNRFNIGEPVCHPKLWKSAKQLNLLLLPLVAFDEQCNRLGMGGGFYDRTLAYLHHQKIWQTPKLIGLAHELQKTPLLQNQSWDIAVAQVVTEKRCYQSPTS